MPLQRKDLLGLQETEPDDIRLILETAQSMKEILGRPIRKVPTLRGKSIVTLFYEPSTRTRTSFELAAKIMSADVSSLAPSSSSIVKGESLKDTVATLQAMGADMFIVRHQASGAPHFIANQVPASVINAGDGMHEHPTQGLLDMFTILERKGRLEGLKVAIVGDITHSRVARSDLWGLAKMGATVRFVGPSTLLPADASKLPVEIYTDLEEGIADCDVINVLRIQLERQERGLFPSIREYSTLFGITRERLRAAKPDVMVMHPGPMNRGIEITAEVADSEDAVITTQVTNGVAVRMALCYLLLGGAANVAAA
ncbi:MAG: aspartate carbamoyltransferase catalytic subunit [Armatimonadota bacterium]|nr:aspartate carbamoyltransferase catalytic subunit [Armatimonadota bacterium]